MKLVSYMLSLCLCSVSAFAQPLYVQLGGGIKGQNQTDLSQVKQFEVGIQRPLGLLDYRFGGGAWIDTTHQGARSSGYGAGYPRLHLCRRCS